MFSKWRNQLWDPEKCSSPWSSIRNTRVLDMGMVLRQRQHTEKGTSAKFPSLCRTTERLDEKIGSRFPEEQWHWANRQTLVANDGRGDDDSNGDGKISEEELSPEFRSYGENRPERDKILDTDFRHKTMEESFRKRREGSKDSARDPIVYGVAAADGAFVIRTGTRLFCVRGE
ncbi:MAG: hypothetical protein U0936_03445 [Planctomycetaceae bacterium]